MTGTNRVVCVPTCKFNVIYQLGHMLIHLFDEGLGFRQVVDYFYVLRNLEIIEKECEELVEVIKSLGLYRFARAVMWIESDVLGLTVEKCIVEPDERRGKKILNDILEGGNFGHYSERYKKSGFYYKGFVKAWRDTILFSLAPQECTAKLFSKLGTVVRHAT